MSKEIFVYVLAIQVVIHMIMDYWGQRSLDAQLKGQRCETGCPRNPVGCATCSAGRRACARHVGSYTVVMFAALVLGTWASGDLDWPLLAGITAGQTFSAVSHYWIDRRFHLRRLASAAHKVELFNLGDQRKYVVAVVKDTGQEVIVIDPQAGVLTDFDNPTPLATGAHKMDQVAHIACLAISAILIAA